MQAHWDKIYQNTDVDQLGWYEAVPEPSLVLLKLCQLKKSDPIIDMGAGASTLSDHLIAKGFQDVLAVDISAAALNLLQERVGNAADKRLTTLRADVTTPFSNIESPRFALWHDRALLHFLVEESQRDSYAANLKHCLRPGGYAIIAVYSKEGAKQCAGLDVHNYDQESLAQLLGPDFELLQAMDYIYQMPSGALRPYIYTLFQKCS